MKLFLLLLILASAVILLVQNQQVIVLYVLGTSSKTALFSLKLPLGFWILLGSLAGMLTSLMIQGLTRSPQSAKTKSPKSPRRKSSQPSAKKPSPPPPKKSDWEVPTLRDWEKPEPEEDDWNIEEPPTEPTISYRSVEPPAKPPLESPVEPFTPERETVKFEVEQSPKSSSREGSVYSYTYRELRDHKETQETSPESREIEPKKGRTPEQVYDANYRVITPPYRNPEDSVTDDEEGDQEEWV